MTDITINATDPARWFDKNSFSSTWNSRNADMLALFDKTIENAARMSFSEYGCGPNAPFTAEVAKSSSRKVVRLDMNQWDEGVWAVDLNREIRDLATTDVGVFSGVLEYINNIEKMLESISGFHTHLLLSYAVRAPLSSFEDFKAAIQHRQVKNGWRSHLSTEEVVNTLSKFGFIKAMSAWQDQLIVVIELY
ncbi:MAG: hypothetical protein ACM3SV_03685 [Betaproteobacteria bacterium]